MDNAPLSSEKVATGCEWYSVGDMWETSCGKAFCFDDGGPIENGMKFCCFCGLCLDELPYEDGDDE